MSAKKSNSQFLKELSEANCNITPLEDYTGISNRIHVICNMCGYEWTPFASNLLRGHGCPKCNVSLKRSHQEFVEEVAAVNKYVEIVGTYKNVDTPILTKCLICGKEYPARPQILLRGGVHNECSRKVKEYHKPPAKSHDAFVKEVEELGKPVDILTPYVNQKTKIYVRCKLCGREKWTSPSVLLSKTGTGCHSCSMDIAKYKMRKKSDVFLAEVNDLNPHVEVISQYQKQGEKVWVRCKKCGHKHSVEPRKLISRIYNCPCCTDGNSFPNRFMTSLLDSNDISYESEMIFDWAADKRYDFYIPSTSTIIEMHGDQHYRKRYEKSNWGRSLEEIQENDLLKERLAKENGIKNYIAIDSSISLPSYICNSIRNSSVSYLLDNVDIADVTRKCLYQSHVMDLVNLYTQGITSIVLLSEKIGVSSEACRRYIELAQQANLI